MFSRPDQKPGLAWNGKLARVGASTSRPITSYLLESHSIARFFSELLASASNQCLHSFYKSLAEEGLERVSGESKHEKTTSWPRDAFTRALRALAQAQQEWERDFPGPAEGDA